MFRQRFPYEQPVFLIIQAGDKGALFIVNAQGELVLRELFVSSIPQAGRVKTNPARAAAPSRKTPPRIRNMRRSRRPFLDTFFFVQCFPIQDSVPAKRRAYALSGGENM